MQPKLVHIERVQKGNRRYYVVTGDAQVEGIQLPNVSTIVNNIGGGGGLAIWAERLVISWLQARLMDELSQPGADALACVQDALDKVQGLTDRERDNAAERGTEIHSCIERLLTGNTQQPVPIKYYQAVANMEAWFATTGLDPRLGESEKMVYNGHDKYAGTIDYRGVDEQGRVWVVDFKSGNHVYDKTALQLAAYAVADSYMTGIPVYKVLAVRIDQDETKFEVKEVNQDASYLAFRDALSLYRNKQLWVKQPKAGRS